MIKIYEPYRISDSSRIAKESVDAGRLTCHNEEFRYVTKRLTDLHKIPVIPVFNGTCATHLAFKAMKLKVPGLKNVIVPNNVYVAAWNSMLMDGEINLIPVDADESTWCVDISKLCDVIEKHSYEDTGILIVHNVGGIVNVPSLKRKFPLHTFIEDNCEGFLGEYEGHRSGTASLASSISFYANKTITCGEGGALIIHPEMHGILNKIQSQGQTDVRYVHDTLAYNYRMTNTQAAILLGQLDLLEEIVDKKNLIFQKYRDGLSRKFLMQEPEKGTKHSGWMFTVRLPGFNYHDNLEALNQDFETRPMFYPMSSHSHLKKYCGDETVALRLSKECFMIPSHPNLSNEDVDLIIKRLNEVAE